MEDGLLGIGAAMLSRSQSRLETTTANVANMTTPGFKKQRVTQTFAGTLSELAATTILTTDFSQGVLKTTDGRLDLALSGPGFFQVRDGQGDLFFTRSGQFIRSTQGRVIDGRGMTLQGSDSNDLVIGPGDVQIAENGTVTQNGRPIGRVGVFLPANGARLGAYAGSLFRSAGFGMEEVANPMVRQGKLEGSNVDMSTEMTEIMSAMRQAEMGSRIVQTFDALTGQAISTFGRSGR
jgi:flagellar basal-body rod protein FlgF